MKIVVALGGNALIEHDKDSSIQAQLKTAQKATKDVVKLISAGNKIVVTHGNGFQIGELALQSPLAPLEVVVAQSQGQIGYLLEQAFVNEFLQKKISKSVAVLLTHTIVNKSDSAFKKPSKPIGPFYSKEKAAMLKKKGVKLIEDSGRGFRRVVASPAPQQILEINTISKLFNGGDLVIACGGGGIPVVREKGVLRGVAAVVDKDLASALLAQKIGAELLLILTEVDFVCLNFGKSNAQEISKMNLAHAKRFLKEGQFGEGSMKPKIVAAVKFLESGGKKVVVCSVKNAFEGFLGKTGTHIVP